jgi:hypothetical protein
VHNARGDGIKALWQVHRHFTETTGAGLAERMKALMSPPQAKHEWEVADMLEKWERNCERLEKYGDMYRLNVMFKVTAVIAMLCGKLKDEFDRPEHTKVRADPREMEEALIKLKRDIKEQARKKKLEHTRASPQDMDLDKVVKDAPKDGEQVGWSGFENEPEWGGNDGADYYGYNDLDYVKGRKGDKGKGKGWQAYGGKGKGKGKGWQPYGGKGQGQGGQYNMPFYGNCHGCGLPGHSSRNCPDTGDKKGFNGNCNTCGVR